MPNAQPNISIQILKKVSNTLDRAGSLIYPDTLRKIQNDSISIWTVKIFYLLIVYY